MFSFSIINTWLETQAYFGMYIYSYRLGFTKKKSIQPLKDVFKIICWYNPQHEIMIWNIYYNILVLLKW